MISIQPLSEIIIPAIVEAFAAANWSKPASIFEKYLKEQTENQRRIWVAMKESGVAGYITLKYDSVYPPFNEHNIPEIMDFNVLPPYRKQGIGTTLLRCAEQQAFLKSEVIGLGVGLYSDYGPALQLYIKHDYKPDGRGITSQYQTSKPGAFVCLDDDLVLWFTKNRAASHQESSISIENSPHYDWGNHCDGWWLHQGSKFSVIQERMPPNTSEKKHYHNYTEQFFYCLKGELSLEVESTLYRLQPHFGLSVPAGLSHTAINSSSEAIDFLVISVPNSHQDRINLDEK